MSAINSKPSKIDRSGELRGKPETLALLEQSASYLQISDGYLSIASAAPKTSEPATEANLRFLTQSQMHDLVGSGEFEKGELYFLGIEPATSQSYFAWSTHWSSDWANRPVEGVKPDGFSTLREVGSTLSDLHVELALHATALTNWHHVHPRCARCGAATHVELGGAVRVCDADGSQHHPRTDSAVIVLIRDQSDRILLGHQPVWPEGRFSCFAGFLEPGETFEQCVSREVFEESGVTVREINYLGSQPWPFPASIMISFEAITDAPDEARPDGEEITEVKWFSRAELKAATKDGSLLLPPSISVARKMIERWFAQGDGSTLTGGETWRP
jgi:NAD+ diphosphatase